MNEHPASGSMSGIPPTPSLVGEVLDGRYKILRKLGEGGMGEVYAAEHVHIEKKFAIKLLRPEIVSNPEAVSRFRQEARSSSSIGHRNIIAIEDFGALPDGRIYMAMELLNGAALNDLITTPQPVDRLLNILIQTGHGLAAAHAKNIVHRDMKPENIFVTIGPQNDDVPKLLDFGIAKVAGNDGNNNLTKTGTIFGTPFYMAPEQALGNTVDARTDIYAMGVIMYEVFAGSLPFQGESFMGILTQHITTEPEPVAQRAGKSGRQLPHGLAEIITRCMHKNPAQRFATMDELVSALINVYRSIAGAGMSTYMEAFTGGVNPTSGRMPVPTPPPMIGGGVAPTMGVTPGGMPQMQHPGHRTGHPSGPQVLPTGQGQAHAHPTGPGQVYSTGSQELYPKKSKTGLIIAIIAILAIGGGVAAFVIVSQQGDGDGSGSQVASGDSGTGSTGSNGSNGSAGVIDPGSNKTGSDKVGSSGSDVKSGSDKIEGSGKVEGSGSDKIEGSGSSTAPPLPKPVTVLVVTNTGERVEAFDENGNQLFKGTSNIEITPGFPRTVTLKATGYEPLTVTIDGTKDKEKFTLKAEKKKPAFDCTGGLTLKPADPNFKACKTQFCKLHPNATDCKGSEPPPQSFDCTTGFNVPFKDPRFQACKKQYCAIKPTDARCDL
jgi:tRNA A-37 threonylcarbamoyl transferase component Bud32